MQYETLVKEWKNTPSEDIENEMQNSRTELQRWYPKLEKSIARYGEYSPSAFADQKFDYFDIAFDSIDKSNVNGKLNALNEIKRILNKGIGKLESEGETWGLETTARQKKKSTKKRTLKKPAIKRVYSEAKDFSSTTLAKFLAELLKK